MRPFEIYTALHNWRNCPDRRPWLIIDVRPNGVYGCFPFSSQDYRGSGFEISEAHPDFVKTGLSKSCFIQDDHIIELKQSQLQRYRGELTGDLLSEFKDFAGL